MIEGSENWEVGPCVDRLGHVTSWDINIKPREGDRGVAVIASVYSGEETARAILAAIQATRPTVLPCDDELVERVAKAICAEMYGPLENGTWAIMSGAGRSSLRRCAHAAIEAMSRPTVVTGEHQSTGDHALPPSGLSQSPLSRAKPAAAIARKGDA